jgi:2-polyprenyl-3-methyl-5-hydroxy-6-metoxy-1,4-benzoquinol methylase
MNAAAKRPCWCGYPTLFAYSEDYDVCKSCGTLVSRAPVAERVSGVRTEDLYSEQYWLKRQREHHELPDIHARSRLDLPERCTHWLQHLLGVQLPPAQVLELGCGHGGYLALLNWAGFTTVGTEMSPWVVEFAHKTFGVDVVAGPVEAQNFPPASFEVIILNDVLEHLEKPLETIALCATLLKPSGFFVVQTPEYKEHLSFQDVVSTGDLFLKHMEHNNDEHLHLFSRRSAGQLFAQIGFPAIEFANPVYEYDMFFTASRAALKKHSAEEIWAALSLRPEGRLVQALLDKAYESNDRWWEIRRLKQGGQ